MVPWGWSSHGFSLSGVNLDFCFAPYAPLEQEFLLWSQQVFVGARVAVGASAVSLLAHAQREWKSLWAAVQRSLCKGLGSEKRWWAAETGLSALQGEPKTSGFPSH